MAGTQSVLADDQRILGIPRSRQTVAIIYPQYGSWVPGGTGLQGFPATSGQGLGGCQTETHSLCQCSARAAQNIWEHHRPAVGSSMHALWQRTQHLREAKSQWLSGGPGTGSAVARPEDRTASAHRLTGPKALPDTSPGLVGGRYLTRYRNQPDKSLHQSGAAMHHRPQDLERALNLSIPAAS